MKNSSTMRPAVLVLDMIVDFTTGKYGSAAARAIRPALSKLLARTRASSVPVVYCQDAHIPSDLELKVWEPHGMFGTRGAQTDSTLRPKGKEPVIPKHTLDAFFGTTLDELLREKGVDTLLLTGVATDVGVQHTSATAFFLGYKLFVPKDGTAGLTPEGHQRGLHYMAQIYGAKVTDIPTLIHKLEEGSYA